jgi:hypothetical protein
MFLRVLLFLCMNLAVAFFARRAARRIFPQADTATRFCAGLVLYFYGIIVGLTLMVKITLPLACGLAGLLALAGWFLGRRRRLLVEMPFGQPRSITAGLLVFLLALALLRILTNGLLHPQFFHDPLTYQLTFAAEWLQQGKITLVPTPFGDPSQAYAPSNASLYYLWLMLPLHMDLFALCGQFPFLLLAFFSVAGLAKLLQIPRPWHLLPPLFMLASPMVREQAASAYSDLALGALFAAAIFFFFRTRRTGELTSFILGAMALGLMLGTKYNSLPLLVLALPLAAAAKFSMMKASRRLPLVAGTAMVLMILGGGYWYARNAWLTGSPVYPFRVEVFGTTLVPGVYGREEMLNWIYHHPGYQAWKETVLALTDRPMVVLYALAVLVVAPWLLLRRKISLLAAYVLILPLLMDRINWHVIPFQVDRFWLPALLLAPLALVALTRKWPRMGYLLLLVALIDLAGSRVKTIEPERPPGMTRREQALLAFRFGPAWNALAAQPGPFIVAYAGNNMPYPLYGPRLDRRVRYINVSGSLGLYFHDYACKNCAVGYSTPEPAPYRRTLDIQEWWKNLRNAEADFLFITRLSEPELINIEHDEQGWPLENIWADRHPELFDPVYSDSLVRICRINHAGQPRWGETDHAEKRPSDALEAYFHLPILGQGEKWFPQALPVIRKHHLQSRWFPPSPVRYPGPR